MVLIIFCFDYVQMYGLIIGDRLCFGDIEIIIQVECDLIIYGEEVKFGGGKVICDGMGQLQISCVGGVMDIVIINVLIFDYLGIYKVDIGLCDGCIVGIGKVGNFDIQFVVMLVIGLGMEIIVGEGWIVMVGGFDVYIYFICLQQVEDVILFGVIIMLGGGMGLVYGMLVIICMLGLWYIGCMIVVMDSVLVNMLILVKGNVLCFEVLEEMVCVGVSMLKLYEDWGIIFVVIDCCLLVVDVMDVQVMIYIDMLNEFGFVENILVVIKGCIIYVFYIEGVGGGYVLDIIKLVGVGNVIFSFINLMWFFIGNMLEEYLDMLMVCYYLDKCVFEDVVFVESCIWCEIIVVEDILYDIGVFLVIFLDSQVMGWVGEVVICIWQIVYKMKVQCGWLVDEIGENDNICVCCYVVKYIINLVIVYGIVYEIGSIEFGKCVDLVIWDLVMFGVKFEMVLVGGMILWVQMGDLNGLILVQLMYMWLMWGVMGCVMQVSSVIFVLQVGLDVGVGVVMLKMVVVVCGMCGIGKVDMVLNNVMFVIEVDFEIYEVCVDGELLICQFVIELFLMQCYFLF